MRHLHLVPNPHATPTLRRLAAPVLALGLFVAGCASTGDKPVPGTPEKDPVRPTLREEAPIGMFLAEADSAIQNWCNLALTANTPARKNQMRMLEEVLNDRMSRRCDELVRELSSGPPINRIRAAAALGFSGKAEAQSPLLAALSDPQPDVAHNALLGLAVLARADTPLDEICRRAEFDSDPQTRAQAAFALRAIVNSGGTGECARGTARRGLSDTEPFVRSQCALVLGLLADGESVPALTGMLKDEFAHVQSAAAEGMLLMVERDATQKGPVGRALVSTWLEARSKDPLKRISMDTLVQISDVNYGDDVMLWSEWAKRLP
ncbi:MAG: HEAT repeat domain-containing protein [Planctomycetota bacterium]|nr:HEAT repeat domain-containing protein [Planctomycetota bacterium]